MTAVAGMHSRSTCFPCWLNRSDPCPCMHHGLQQSFCGNALISCHVFMRISHYYYNICGSLVIGFNLWGFSRIHASNLPNVALQKMPNALVHKFQRPYAAAAARISASLANKPGIFLFLRSLIDIVGRKFFNNSIK